MKRVPLYLASNNPSVPPPANKTGMPLTKLGPSQAIPNRSNVCNDDKLQSSNMLQQQLPYDANDIFYFEY